MHESVLRFLRETLSEGNVRGLRILEVGALDINGSPRSVVGPLGPATYVGVDLTIGKGVDFVLPSWGITRFFGEGSFDGVISTEALEHDPFWRHTVREIKRVVRPGGWVLITARGGSFPWHGFPDDYWRFDLEDFRKAFSDFAIERLVPDSEPGVCLFARRPLSPTKEADLESIQPRLIPSPWGPRIVVYTAIYGGRHSTYFPPPQGPWTTCLFTDNPSLSAPRVLTPPDVGEAPSPRWKARRVKILSHRYLPPHDLSLWVDGDFLWTYGSPTMILARLLRNGDVGAVRHLQRDCVYQEIDACLRLGLDDPCALGRARERLLELQVPAHGGLAMTGVLARRDGAGSRALCEAWWAEMMASGCMRDQVALEAVRRKFSMHLEPVSGWMGLGLAEVSNA